MSTSTPRVTMPFRALWMPSLSALFSASPLTGKPLYIRPLWAKWGRPSTCEWANPWYCTRYTSPATSCPVKRDVDSVCSNGLAFRASCSVFRSRAMDTETPSSTSPAAARRVSSVIRLRVPISSSGPQRPQLEISSIHWSNSARLTDSAPWPAAGRGRAAAATSSTRTSGTATVRTPPGACAG